MSLVAPSFSPMNGGGSEYRMRRVPGLRVRGSPNYTERQRLLRSDCTEAENILWHFLRAKQLHGKKFRRQHGIGPYIADFYCDELKLVVELDGSVHNTVEAREYDRERDRYLIEAGYTVLHIPNDEIMEDVSIGLHKIEALLGVYPPPFMGELEGAN